MIKTLNWKKIIGVALAGCTMASSMAMSAGAVDVNDQSTTRSGNIYIYNWDGELLDQTNYEFEVPAKATAAQQEAMMASAVQQEAAKANEDVAEIAAQAAANAFNEIMSTPAARSVTAEQFYFLSKVPATATTVPALEGSGTGGGLMANATLDRNMSKVCAFFTNVDSRIYRLNARIENHGPTSPWSTKCSIVDIPIGNNGSTNQNDAVFIVGRTYNGEVFNASKNDKLYLYASAKYTRNNVTGTAEGYIMGAYA